MAFSLRDGVRYSKNDIITPKTLTEGMGTGQVASNGSGASLHYWTGTGTDTRTVTTTNFPCLVWSGDRDWYRVMEPAGIMPEPKKEEKGPMKTLYNVVVVSKTEEILLDKKVVAEDRDEARFLAGVDSVLREKSLKPGDVTVLCPEIGKVKVEEKIQRVRVVKE